jgi:hypothetical protein
MGDDPIVRASWAGTAVFIVTSGVAVGVDGARGVAVAVDLALFLAGTVAFVVALARGIARSRVEQITLPGLFFLSGSAPAGVRRQLLASAAVQVVVAFVTAGARPYTSLAFGILVPVYGLGLAGFWGATRGTYAPRG